MTIEKAVIALILSLLFAGPAWAAQLRVPDDFPTIQAAIDASQEGDEVILSPNRYTGEGNRDIEFRGKAIAVRSDNPTDWAIIEKTIIDCGGTEAEPHRAFHFRGGETETAQVLGLTITNGLAFEGGAILCHKSSPVIANCLLINNTAHDSNGGAIALFYAENPQVFHCIIRDNKSTHTGGAICAIENDRIQIVNCAMIGNEAQSKGGGVYSRDNRSIKIVNCTILNNRAGFSGGVYGIGDLGTRAALVNTIIWGNQYPGLGGAHAWNALTVSRCVLQELWEGPGNIQQDPGLNGDGRILLSDSPCVDNGVEYRPVKIEVDIDFKERLLGRAIDIGCHELAQ